MDGQRGIQDLNPLSELRPLLCLPLTFNLGVTWYGGEGKDEDVEQEQRNRSCLCARCEQPNLGRSREEVRSWGRRLIVLWLGQVVSVSQRYCGRYLTSGCPGSVNLEVPCQATPRPDATHWEGLQVVSRGVSSSTHTRSPVGPCTQPGSEEGVGRRLPGWCKCKCSAVPGRAALRWVGPVSMFDASPVGRRAAGRLQHCSSAGSGGPGGANGQGTAAPLCCPAVAFAFPVTGQPEPAKAWVYEKVHLPTPFAGTSRRLPQDWDCWLCPTTLPQCVTGCSSLSLCLRARGVNARARQGNVQVPVSSSFIQRARRQLMWTRFDLHASDTRLRNVTSAAWT
jgi:hypothetical protein